MPGFKLRSENILEAGTIRTKTKAITEEDFGYRNLISMWESPLCHAARCLLAAGLKGGKQVHQGTLY